MTKLFSFHILLLFIIMFSCKASEANEQVVVIKEKIEFVNDSSGHTIQSRFKLPPSFQRINAGPNAFASYLRALPLKPKGSKVLHYDGSVKSNPIHEAVVDQPIGAIDLHQCADAIIRLRADYFRSIDQPELISFKFTNGMNVPYAKWMEGYRIVINGNNTKWVKKQMPTDSDESYWSYLETIFMYAGTLSLSKELDSKLLHDMSIGDVFIKGGAPGHAVIVVDMAQDTSGKKLFMLAQSYMPAQETHVLKNLNDSSISPWYRLDDIKSGLSTPEWDFNKENLKQFN